MDKVRIFAETTSVKGVPRFMKAKSLPIRILWVISVTGLLLISIVECVYLVQQYLYRTKVVQVKDINALKDFYDYPELFALPTVTVCNQNPLTAYNGHDGISWQQYQEVISHLLAEEDAALRDRYMSPSGYVEYLGPQAVANNKAMHDFIIDCHTGSLTTTEWNTCTYFGWNVTYLPSVKYSQCYTISFHSFSYNDVLSLTLYLDEVNAQMVEYSSELKATRGVAVIIHTPGQIPFVSEAQFAAAGHLTTFSVRKTLYERLGDSNDPCWDSTVSTDIHDLSGTHYTYTQIGCSMAIFQTAIMEACGCISSEFVVLPENSRVQDLHFCGAVSENFTQMATELQCVQHTITDSLIDEVMTSCIVPCNETFHSVSVSSSPWPTETAQLSFYQNFIKHKSFAEHFNAYDRIYNDYISTQDSSKAVGELEQLSLIEKNFARIDIIIPEIRADLYRVVYQMSFESLLASIGGNLNLWSGISAIVLIELLDLCIKLFLSALNPQNRIVVNECKPESGRR